MNPYYFEFLFVDFNLWYNLGGNSNSHLFCTGANKMVLVTNVCQDSCSNKTHHPKHLEPLCSGMYLHKRS